MTVSHVIFYVCSCIRHVRLFVQMYGLIWLLDLKLKLDDVEIVILILSAICHDLDHPGYNNAYQVSEKLDNP